MSGYLWATLYVCSPGANVTLTATPATVTPGVTPHVALTCRVTGNVTAATPAVVGRRGAAGGRVFEEKRLTTSDGQELIQTFEDRAISIRDTSDSADIDIINSVVIKNIK